MIRNATIALLFGLMLGCAHSRNKVTQAALRGSVTFRGTLPADSTLRIHLIETIPTPASTNILAVDQLNFEGGSPVAFSIRYNAARIRSENSYTLIAKASREADGMLIMKSDALRVLTPGSPTNGIVLVLAPAK
ncbi:MAG: YbaY family lipoprotein [Limisphaerales bacterium]